MSGAHINTRITHPLSPGLRALQRVGHTSTHESPIPCPRASEHCSEWGTRQHTNHPSLVSGSQSTAVSGAHINTQITHLLSPGLGALQRVGHTSTHESPIPCLRVSEHCSEWGTRQHTNHPSLVSRPQSTAVSRGHVNTRIAHPLSPGLRALQ